MTVAGRAPAKAYDVSGIATLGDSENLAGSRLVLFTLPEGQQGDRPRRLRRHLGGRRRRDHAGAAQGRDRARARAREFAVRTGKEQAEKQAQDLSDALGFIRTALLVFAAVALLVGSFLIFNTFSVTVAQRTKEFALLRTLGASRGQVLRSVLAETFVIGVLASLIGIACGLALAPGLAALLSSFGHRPRHHQHGAASRGPIIVGLAGRRRRHRRLGLRARAPRDADRARGGDARQRSRPAPAACASAGS